MESATGVDDKAASAITEAQAHMFALLRTVDYNSFDGNKVVDDLLRWRHLWEAVTAGWCSYSTGNRFEAVCDLHSLIYLPENLWMVDTVHLLTSGIDDPLLRDHGTPDRSRRTLPSGTHCAGRCSRDPKGENSR